MDIRCHLTGFNVCLPDTQTSCDFIIFQWVWLKKHKLTFEYKCYFIVYTFNFANAWVPGGETSIFRVIKAQPWLLFSRDISSQWRHWLINVVASLRKLTSTTYANLELEHDRKCKHGFIFLITLKPKQNADDILKCILLNENIWIPLKIVLKFVAYVRINNIPALVQITIFQRLVGAKPLSGPMMVILLTHTCISVTRPQWVQPNSRDR